MKSGAVRSVATSALALLSNESVLVGVGLRRFSTGGRPV